MYKLQELDERCGLLRPGMKVLDVGAAPGSWMQYTAKIIGPSGKVLGLDLQPIKAIGPNVVTAVCDVCDTEKVLATVAAQGWKYADIVLSDVAPNTSGVKDVDQWRSIELNQQVLAVAARVLKPSRGTVVMKVLRGADFDGFLAEIKRKFKRVKIVTVQASRDRSSEVYLVCA